MPKIVGNKRIAIIFVAPLIIVIFLGLFFYRNGRQTIEYNHWVAHTFEVISVIVNIRADVKDMETGQRGYLITGKEMYLEPYNIAVVSVGPDLEKAFQLTKGNATQQKELDILKSLIIEKGTELKKTINLRRTQGFEAAQAVVATDIGKKYMDRIRNVVIEMLNHENDLFKKSIQAQQVSINNLTLVSLLGIFLVFLFSMATSFLIRHINRATVELHRADNKIKIIYKELQRSNEELEQFAYVASHDLQEPLRMISSFTQLLEKKYKDKLDTQAQEYISFAVDGAKRMQILIDDLLAFSKVGHKDAPRAMVDLNKICQHIIEDMKISIADSQAVVHWDLLPMLYANERQMTQLFSNLISNGMKYRSERPPVVKITSQKKGEHQWQFSVSDNGIGIDEQYFGKLFVIFKRLHTKKEYKGTGIGLALCKKIVEIYDGRIWIDSKVGMGTTFHFILNEGEMHETN